MTNNKDFNSKDIIHEKNGDIEYLKFRILEKYNNKIKHLITLRHGGVSTYPMDSLSFRISEGQKKENVFKNLEKVSKILGISREDIFKGKQAHTDNILIIDEENKHSYRFLDISKEEFDGYICNKANIATLVTTADCNPIIIYDPVNNVYANIHSGWRGTVKQIYLKALKVMNKKFSSKYEDLIVCIGPSIRKCCCSSSDENFKKIFINVWENEEEYIYYEKNKKTFHIDLTYLIKKDLLKYGIKKENIVISDVCTRCNNESFFSYRYATQHNYKDYGTMATIVFLS